MTAILLRWKDIRTMCRFTRQNTRTTTYSTWNLPFLYSICPKIPAGWLRKKSILPLRSMPTTEGRARNRRVEIKVYNSYIEWLHCIRTDNGINLAADNGLFFRHSLRAAIGLIAFALLIHRQSDESCFNGDSYIYDCAADKEIKWADRSGLFGD